MNYSLKVLLYVLTWMIAWLIISSILDAGFLSTDVYDSEGKGKVITFGLTALISFAGGASLFNEVFHNSESKGK